MSHSVLLDAPRKRAACPIPTLPVLALWNEFARALAARERVCVWRSSESAVGAMVQRQTELSPECIIFSLACLFGASACRPPKRLFDATGWNRHGSNRPHGRSHACMHHAHVPCAMRMCMCARAPPASMPSARAYSLTHSLACARALSLSAQIQTPSRSLCNN